jgi:serine/threonine protein kinase
MKEVYETADHVILVLDLVTGGELLEKVLDLGSYTERDASIIMLSLFRAIKYLHDLGIAHRDLKVCFLLFFFFC